MVQNVSIFTFPPEKKVPRQRIVAVTTMQQIKIQIHPCISKTVVLKCYFMSSVATAPAIS